MLLNRAFRNVGSTSQHMRGFLGGKRSFHKTTQSLKEEVFILSSSRTPMGSFQSSLASLSSTHLGSLAIKDAVDKSGVTNSHIDEVFMGNVLSAGCKPAPARQATLSSGLPNSIPCTTVNKVCASGMKSVILASQTILAGDNQCVVAGGMESMSNVPYYLPQYRKGAGLGHGKVLDGILTDALWDAFDDHHMGSCAEICADTHGFTREDQDNYALESYKRSAEATSSGRFKEEITPVEIVLPRGKGTVLVEEDEEFSRLKKEKIGVLRPAFKADGSVTAANASTINDGASALVVASGSFVNAKKLTPVARILATADAATAPVDFPIAPSLAIPIALKKCGLTVDDIDLWEINEAFSVVALANMKILKLDHEKVNVNGGAVSLGHPVGSSGSRIIVSLVHALKQRGLKTGCASICNGGGGASAIIVQLV